MTSSNQKGEPASKPLRIGSDEFEVIFQITKEIYSLPGERLLEVGYPPAVAGYLLAALRAVRGRMENASFVQFYFVPEVNCDYQVPPVAQLRANPRDSSPTDISIDIPLAAAIDWHALASEIASSLGEREVFLRTGYSVEEVRGALHALTNFG